MPKPYHSGREAVVRLAFRKPHPVPRGHGAGAQCAVTKTARRTGPAGAEHFERKKYLVQVGHCIHRVIQFLLRRLAFQVVQHLRDRHTQQSAQPRARA